MYPEIKQEELVIRALKGQQWIRDSHGSLFDRGSADSHYGRRQDPHYKVDGEEIKVTDAASINEYLAGYAWNERYGDKKEWA